MAVVTVIDKRLEKFTKVPNWFMDSRLNIYAQQTWKVLKSYDHQGKGVVWPGVDTIARKAGISKRSVDRAIAELRAAGLISREYRLGKNGRRLSNRYSGAKHILPGAAGRAVVH